MKDVMKALTEKGASEDTINKFKTSAGSYAKKIVANIGDYEFYTGESMAANGMYAPPTTPNPLSTNQHTAGSSFSTTVKTA